MRLLSAVSVMFLGFSAVAHGDSCTGLCLQQVTCPAGQSTTISGTVYAPNGTDPLPNILVYIPNAPVAAFTPGVSCPVIGAPPSGSPLVGATTAVDGTFQITNVPVGTNIPLVIQTGRWRRQVVVPTTTSCADTAFSTRMPKNQGEGDIPKIAVATGEADQVECVLRKVGIDDAEFTDASGTGRINFYGSAGSPGSLIDAATPSANVLMNTVANLEAYDVLMLPCEGGAYGKTSAQLANLIAFANAGGRVYSSHYSYVWMYENPPFSTVANWTGKSLSPTPDPGVGTIDTTFSDGKTLQQWLQLVGATTTPGQMPIATLRQDMNGVNPPTQSYMTLNNAAYSNPVMQFVFDTPVGSTGNQCGRVLFNEYHVETGSGTGKLFPTECSSTTAALTPQEKLLEYSLFELTSEGSAATLTPTTQDFGSVSIGFNSAAKTFVWTNNSTFPSTVTLLTGSGDFAVTANTCATVAAGASCTISVVFSPTALGARTGTLTVGSSGSTLLASLTGTGVPGLNISLTTLDFGSLDVGATLTKSFTVSNAAPGAIAVAATVTGDFAAVPACGATLAAGASCLVNVTFQPTTTGARAGTVTVNGGGGTAALTGIGLDFSIEALPASGNVVAGKGGGFNVTTTPIAGFAAGLKLSCSTPATASTCTMASTSVAGSAAVMTAVTLTTTAQYTVVGYTGFLWFAGLGSGALLWFRRKSTGGLVRWSVIAVLLAAGSLGLSGCSGKLPGQNASYTSPGPYAVTVTATDGFLVHTATYTMTVTTQ